MLFQFPVCGKESVLCTRLNIHLGHGRGFMILFKWMNATDKGAYQKQRAGHVTLQPHPSGVIWLCLLKGSIPWLVQHLKNHTALHMISWHTLVVLSPKKREVFWASFSFNRTSLASLYCAYWEWWGKFSTVITIVGSGSRQNWLESLSQ